MSDLTEHLSFRAPVESVNSHLIVKVPSTTSSQLPSRGPLMVVGTINDVSFHAPLEPDGAKGHYLPIDTQLLHRCKVAAGDTVAVQIAPTKEWTEQDIPSDIKQAVFADEQALQTWNATTPAARWDWVRWIRATNVEETRKKRIRVACSKLRSGERRPCCFNRSACTDPAVSHSGVLISA